MFYPHTPGLTLDPPGESPEETYFDVAGRRVHGWVAWPAPGTELPGGVVVVPGLGLPQYTFPTARALAVLGLRCTVLDLPGSAPPVRTRPALTAALAVRDRRPDLALVLAGPTSPRGSGGCRFSRRRRSPRTGATPCASW
jgi:hypothetical protein